MPTRRVASRCVASHHAPYSNPVLHNRSTSRLLRLTLRVLVQSIADFSKDSYNDGGKAAAAALAALAPVLALAANADGAKPTVLRQRGCWSMEKAPSMCPPWVREDPVARGIHVVCRSNRLRLATSVGRCSLARGISDDHGNDGSASRLLWLLLLLLRSPSSPNTVVTTCTVSRTISRKACDVDSSVSNNGSSRPSIKVSTTRYRCMRPVCHSSWADRALS
mmetsp:Transcript_16026/g.34729  ORF Transcript_16026/g.34729 Transcript_16026/m.34729 type:complete len:221 (+) Transcript_16026:275-937(+)